MSVQNFMQEIVTLDDQLTDGSPPLWYAFKVRTSGELRVRAALEYKGYETFLPTQLEVRKYTDRLKKIDAPLFPGYIFSRLDVSKRLPLLTTPGVESIISMAGVPQPIPEQEIEAVRNVVES